MFLHSRCDFCSEFKGVDVRHPCNPDIFHVNSHRLLPSKSQGNCRRTPNSNTSKPRRTPKNSHRSATRTRFPKDFHSRPFSTDHDGQAADAYFWHPVPSEVFLMWQNALSERPVWYSAKIVFRLCKLPTLLNLLSLPSFYASFQDFKKYGVL